MKMKILLGMVKLFINIGKKHRIGAGDILGAIAGEAGIPGSKIGRIELQEDFSYVDISSDCVDDVLESMGTGVIKGKKVKIEKNEKVNINIELRSFSYHGNTVFFS
jgi:ATP-dependent RNA helicase DeaD